MQFADVLIESVIFTQNSLAFLAQAFKRWQRGMCD
jgi:hypothetical protein